MRVSYFICCKRNNDIIFLLHIAIFKKSDEFESIDKTQLKIVSVFIISPHKITGLAIRSLFWCRSDNMENSTPQIIHGIISYGIPYLFSLFLKMFFLLLKI